MSVSSALRTDTDTFRDIAWGTHLCYLYHSEEGLIDVLVSYFAEGLRRNALCLWLSSEPLAQHVMRSLRAEIPDYDQVHLRGQLEAVSCSDWFLRGGEVDFFAAVERGVLAQGRAKALGCDGIWIAGDLSWLERSHWASLVAYEETVGQLIAGAPVVGLCAYSIRSIGLPEGLDLYRTHKSIIVSRGGGWEVVSSLEQTRVENALKESEVIYKQLFDGMLDGIEVIDLSTMRVLAANQAMANIFGFASPDLIVGIDALNHIPVENREHVAAMVSEMLIENDMQKVVDLRAIREDGSEIWISAKGVRTEYKGEVAGLISVRDITEQKKAERALLESQRDLQAVFDGVKDGIAVLDLSGRVEKVNRRVLDVTGYAESEIVGKCYDELGMFGAEDIAKMSDAVAPLLAGHSPPPMELVFTTRAGGRLVLDLGVTPLRRGQDVVGSIAVFRNVTDHRHAMDLLCESERRSRLLVENANEGILVAQDGYVVYGNDKTWELLGRLGYTEHEFLSQPFVNVIHPDDGQMVAEAHARRMAGEQFSNIYQFRVVGKTGEVRWVEINAVRLDWDGSPATLAFIDDVSDRRKAEDELRKREQEFRALAENAADVVCRSDRQHRILYINSTVERLTGIPRETFIGKTIGELGARRDLVKFWEEAGLAVFDSGREKAIEYVLPTLDGHRHLEACITPEFARDGSVESILLVSRDITERKRAEEALRESEQRYRMMADHASDVIWTVDRDLRLTYVSPAVERMTGFSVQEAMVQPIGKLMADGSAQEAARVLGEELALCDRDAGREPATKTVQFQSKRKDGSVFWVEATMSVIIDSDRRPAGILGISRDIDARRRAQEAVAESEKRYRLLAENISDVIWVTDVDLRPTYISPSIQRLVGISADQAMSRGYDRNSMLESSAKKVEELFAKVMAAAAVKGNNNELLGPIEIELLRDDGSSIVVESTGTAIKRRGRTPGSVHGCNA